MSQWTPRKVAATGFGTSLLGLYLFLRSKSDNVPRDLLAILRTIKYKRFIMSKMKGEWTTADLLREAVEKYHNKEAIRFIQDDGTTRSYTFAELDQQANKVANWALSVGIKAGEVLALMMDNRPEFLFTWLGLAKVGAITSLINTHLKGVPLVHSMSVCSAKYFIIGNEHIHQVNDIRSQVHPAPPTPSNAPPTPTRWFSWGGNPVNGYEHLDEVFKAQSTAEPPRSARAGRKATDDLMYIYTSGTTGNPKASKIKHLRFLSAGAGFVSAYSVDSSDRIYCALPLYHSAGGLVGFGTTLASGVTFVFRKKFSASNFWSDCIQHNCTIIQYIGELCRYLLLHPPSPHDKAHKIRMAIGNGLRPDIWSAFSTRFNIANMGEFYASTEGNAALINALFKPGAVGFVPPLLRPLFPVKIIKFDVEKEQPIRNKDGLCIECQPGEVGELVGMIETTDPTRQFYGYTDKSATEKKILRNVMKKGDAYFRTGDLLRSDKDGFYYFVDRIGDTFRWKGENVATSEVAEVISAVPGVLEVNVYGVQVPNHDGRAGMASLVVDQKSFDMQSFYNHIKKQLPGYAAPLFVRLQSQIDITTTFKHKKVELVKEGFHPGTVKDPLFFRDDHVGKFVPLDQALYDKIVVSAKL